MGYTSSSYHSASREQNLVERSAGTAADRYSATSAQSRSERYMDDDRPYRDRVKDRREKYASRYEKERLPSKHHHYHRKHESGSRDRSSRDVSRERGTSRHERGDRGEYDRSRDRERDIKRRSDPKERDYRERDRSRERSRSDLERSKERRYTAARSDSRDYASVGVESSNTATYTSGIPPSGSSAYYLPSSHAAHNSSAVTYSGYHSYGYGAETMVPQHHNWNAHSKTWPATQPPPNQPPPPPPPDTTPNWDDPEPPEAEEPETTAIAATIEKSLESSLRNTASNHENEEKPDADMTNVDLDTRIAMMFKGKSFGNAPPFLQMDSSESDNEKPTEKEAEEGEVQSDSNEKKKKSSSTTSPPEKLHKSKRDDKIGNKKNSGILAQQGTSDISSSDDDILLKKESYSPILQGHMKKDDDNMSLSSLSSHEGCQQRLEEEPPPATVCTTSAAPSSSTATTTIDGM